MLLLENGDQSRASTSIRAGLATLQLTTPEAATRKLWNQWPNLYCQESGNDYHTFGHQISYNTLGHQISVNTVGHQINDNTSDKLILLDTRLASGYQIKVDT